MKKKKIRKEINTPEFILNIKDYFSYRHHVIIVSSILIIILLFIIFAFLFSKTEMMHQKNLEKSLKQMAGEFYEDYYFNLINDSLNGLNKSEYLANFSTIGIKITLENLENYDNNKYKDEIAEFVNTKTNVSCNKYNTKAIIYPRNPYGKEDYDIEVELECISGLEEENMKE